MSVLSTAGKTAVLLGAGGLGILAALKLRDDRYVDGIWRYLEQLPGSAEPFNADMVVALPDPARRFFLHALQPGTRLASKLHWRYSGELKAGKGMPWLSLKAEQIVVIDRGFVWKARANKGPIVLTAADHYLDGEGRMRVSLFGLFPVVNATGPDLSKSALGRLLIESAVLPSALLPSPNVQIEGIDRYHFRASVSLHGETTPITLTVDEDGRLKEILIQRWGNQTEDGSFRYIPYGATVLEERTFGGYTIPSRVAIGWWYGTERHEEVVRIKVEWAKLG